MAPLSSQFPLVVPVLIGVASGVAVVIFALTRHPVIQKKRKLEEEVHGCDQADATVDITEEVVVCQALSPELVWPRSPYAKLNSSTAGEWNSMVPDNEVVSLVLVSALEWSESTAVARSIACCKTVHGEVATEGRLALGHVVVKARTCAVWLHKTSATHIRSLEFRPCGRQALARGLEHLHNMPHLETIKCKGQSLTAADCEVLAKAATRENGMLKMINVEACRINDQGAEAFSNTGSVRTLCIRKNNLSDKAVESIAVGLPGGCLEVLNLKANSVKDNGVLALSNVIGGCPHLRVLNLRNNKVTCIGANALAEALCVPESKIQKLRLSHNAIRDPGAKALGGLLPKLVELDLDFNKVTDECKATLYDMLANAEHDARTEGRDAPLLLCGPSPLITESQANA